MTNVNKDIFLLCAFFPQELKKDDIQDVWGQKQRFYFSQIHYSWKHIKYFQSKIYLLAEVIDDRMYPFY